MENKKCLKPPTSTKNELMINVNPYEKNLWIDEPQGLGAEIHTHQKKSYDSYAHMGLFGTGQEIFQV